MIKTWWGMGLTAVMVVAVVGILGLSASGHVPFGPVRKAGPQPDSPPAWARRIALADEALGRADLSRAIYEWREAYGAALRNGRSDGLIAVGDRAIRLAELTGGSGYFLTEAKYVYVHAALRARTEQSRDTIRAIAEVFDRLGDTERAQAMRHIAASAS